MECTVCTETIDLPVVCPKCSYSACTFCTRRYLLSDQKIEPRCMNCSIGWSMDFVYSSIDRDFEQEFRTHRTKLILEREKSLLPETQNYVELEKEVNKVRANIKKLTEEITKIKWTKSDKLVSLKEERKVLMKHRSKLLRELEKFDPNEQKGFLGVVKKTKVKFSLKCPNTNCRGYVTETKCSLCSTEVCKDCMEPIDNEHKCDPNILENVKLLKKDSKNCPKCRTVIYKISGCDQMYCTECHTPFSWKTGQIETGRVHNPHYYEYKRAHNIPIPRELGDVPCGGPTEFSALHDRVHKLNGCRKNWGDIFDLVPCISQSCDQDIKNLQDIHRAVGHYRAISTQYYTSRVRADENFDLRVRYLKNDLTWDRFHVILKTRDKKKQKNQTVQLILEMFCNTVDDLLRNILTFTLKNELLNFFKEVKALVNYTNTALAEANRRFKTKVPTIELSDIYLNWM